MIWPKLRDVERELYPTLGQMYAELARSTPRPRQPPPRRVPSRLMHGGPEAMGYLLRDPTVDHMTAVQYAAATQGEAAQAPKGSGSC
jgi:hypothetical protein